MTRTLFFAFFLRLSVAMALILLLRTWLVPHGWVLSTLLVFAWASLNAYLLSRSVRDNVRPLLTSASTLGGPPASTEATERLHLADQLRRNTEPGRYSDFDALARTLHHSAREIDRALAAAASASQELEAMIDSIQDAVVAVDPAGRIQWTNRRLQQLLPARGSAPSPGQPTSNPVRIGHALVQTIRDPDVLECIRSALSDRTSVDRRSTSLVPGRIFEITASPVPNGGAVAVLHDITRIEHVERTQRDFVANVSHELRTPLTSITGYVETLLDHERGLSPNAREFLSTILKNATRMNRLTEDLLLMTRADSAEAKLHPSPVSADTLVRDAVQAMTGLVQDAQATLEVGETTSLKVLADTDAAVQILSNLIENGVKYGRNRAGESARVIVSAQPSADGPNAVQFSVRDFGPGIPSEHLERIFERFYRVDKARSRDSGGTGLGLSIARHMVTAQGGSIRAESELNHGSNFLFTLPAAD